MHRRQYGNKNQSLFCGKYVYLLQPFIFHCADGLFYDSSINACNWPESVKCGSSADVTLYQHNICNRLGSGLYSDPHRSNEFFWCIDNQRKKMACSYGLYFDSFTGICKNSNEARYQKVSLPDFLMMIFISE